MRFAHFNVDWRLQDHRVYVVLRIGWSNYGRTCDATVMGNGRMALWIL